MTHDEIVARLADHFPGVALDSQKPAAGDPFVAVPAERVADVLQALRDDAETRMDYLSCLSGVDAKDNLGVVYHLFSIPLKHGVVVKALVPKARPEVPSVSEVFSTANWFEREAAELLGITFLGHPDPRHLLLTDDWDGFPLRKDYKPPQEYHGVPWDRPDPLDLLAPPAAPPPKPPTPATKPDGGGQ
jgi:NADH-quinone oxidoreductase subunit C